MSRRTKRAARERRRWALNDEPWPDEEELFDCGGEVHIAIDCTSGGFPFGYPLAEFREMSMEDDGERGWARASRALRAAVRGSSGADPDVGRVRKIGEGLSREAFAAEVDVEADGWPRLLVALVPLRGKRAVVPVEQAAVEREARLLTFLATRDLGVRVPEIAVAVRVGRESVLGCDFVLVCDFVEGLPVDLRSGRMGSVKPWEIVAKAAAAVHGVSTEGLEWLPGHATRRAHGEASLEALDELAHVSDATVRAAFDWLREHLPPDEPSKLLHGDLLGQNLRLDLFGGPLGVIDWACALRGDPAYDLAIVTRGVRRPFQLEGGMGKLLEAYGQAVGAGTPRMGETDVRFHEIVLHLEWFRKAVAGQEGVEPVQTVLARLRNLVRRG